MTQEATLIRPPLFQDRSFWGLNLTQFFGAFNDNLFKQLVMLDCLDQASQGGRDLQGLGLVLFSIPFIGISGFAGFLSDRFSKRTIIVLCKMAEVLIVILGMIGFLLHSLPFLLAVLCLMGAHSAFFGPSKYGILPEMLRDQDLPRANGMMLMATFLAIIFGLTAAGMAKYFFNSTLWLASLPCLVIALLGLVTSLAIRPTPVAQPNLKFDASSLLIASQTRQLLRNSPSLLWVLLMSSAFWFVGGTVYPPAINALAKEQFHLDDLITGMMAASTGVGIALGCVVAGILSKNRVRGWIVRMGAWGLTLSLLALALPGPGWDKVRDEIRELKSVAGVSVPANPTAVAVNSAGTPAVEGTAGVGAEKTTTISETERDQQVQVAATGEVADKTAERAARDQRLSPAERFYRGTLLGPYGSVVALICVGLFAGFYSVPLQVFLQASAPVEQKGRIIGANNLINWIGIASAGAVCFAGRVLLVDTLMLPYASLFGMAAALMLPVAAFYSPPDVAIEQEA
ncbi:MFS transporter [Schlesneria sp. T3-172]|uniref:MFS transporter n=1 Tax=Schlesneria sphaerica TaxID=3373610 RepID=UPI0037C605D1